MPLNILLVDEDADFADATAGSLREEGHEVSVARDGASATAIARETKPDVVVLDLMVSNSNGYDLARSLRRELPNTTPIIVATRMREATHVEDIDLMLSKPIPAELFGGLIEYIRRRRWGIVMGRAAR